MVSGTPCIGDSGAGVATGVFDSILDEIGDELHMQSAIKDRRPASFDPGSTSSLPLQTPPV